MKKALKELIENAPKKTKGAFKFFLFISNGVYDGFWGKNGYNNILILGRSVDDNKWYRISEFGDKFDIYRTKLSFNLDIPKDLGVPRIWFSEPIYIDNEPEMSSVVGYTNGYDGGI